MNEFPPLLLERLRHYFMTYKLIPGQESHVSIGKAYNRAHAETIIRAAMEDYNETYGQK